MGRRRRLLLAAALPALAWGGGVAAQAADEARPPARPAAEGALSPPAETPTPPRPPAPPRPSGRLTPPEAAAGPPAAGPGAQGALIPPDAGLRDPAPVDAQSPASPAAPPMRSQLREDDFTFAACRLALFTLGAGAHEVAPVTGDIADCGIDRPLAVRSILPGVALAGEPVMRCDTARSLAFWMRDFVQPAARRLPGAPHVASLEPGTTYDCRPRIGTAEARLSEHAFGNAYDVAGFVMDDGRRIAVGPADEGSPEAAFLAAVRWAACMDFTTVLGPGSNAAHDGHLHLDIRQRSGGYRVCE